MCSIVQLQSTGAAENFEASLALVLRQFSVVRRPQVFRSVHRADSAAARLYKVLLLALNCKKLICYL